METKFLGPISPHRSVLCNFLAALFSIALVLPITFMILDRDLPLKLSYMPLEPHEVISGEQVKVRWIADVRRPNCEGTFIRRIVDSAGFISETKPLPIETFEKLKGHNRGVFHKFITMPTITPGPGFYQITTTYWCNPIQKHFWPIVNKEERLSFVAVQGKSGQN